MERRMLDIQIKEDELKLREATITRLMVGAGVSEVQSQQTLQKSFENTFGSQRLQLEGGAKGIENFLTRFDQYKEELEQRERDLS